MKRFINATLVIIICSLNSKAQVPEILKDIDTNKEIGSNPRWFTESNGKTFFSATKNEDGNELWVSDGTLSGTNLVMDIYSGYENSYPMNLTSFRDKIYFSASSAGGQGLWVSDGSAAGTLLIKKIDVGAGTTYYPYHYAVYDDRLYFLANDGLTGQELWVTDGTNAGTYLLKDINSGINNSDPRYGIVCSNKLYFQANDGITGDELWVTDGSSTGTHLVKDINPGILNSSPFDFVIYKDKLFFSAINTTSGKEMWMTDGTETGTHMVKDIYPGIEGYVSGITVYKDKLYFSAKDNINGSELWRSDGTETGTSMLKNINTSGSSSPSSFTVYKDKLYFSATDSAHGFETWVTDGTSGGTSLFKDINTNIKGNSYSNLYTVYNDKLYFKATTDDPTFEYNLWETDGDPAHTNILSASVTTKKSPLKDAQELKVCNGSLFFQAAYTIDESLEPYVLTVPLSIASNTQKKVDIQLFPNPVNSRLTAMSILPINDFKIFDITGKTILTNSFQINNTISIDVSHLENGIYYIQFIVSDFTAYSKFIIQH